jgi:hypothetical protein
MKLIRRFTLLVILYCFILILFSRFFHSNRDETDLYWDLAVTYDTNENPFEQPSKLVEPPKKSLTRRSRRQDDFYVDPDDSEELETIQFVQSLSVFRELI